MQFHACIFVKIHGRTIEILSVGWLRYEANALGNDDKVKIFLCSLADYYWMA